jgi:hypothetical protein
MIGTIGGCEGVLERVECEEIEARCNRREKNDEFRRNRTKTRSMTWTQGERTPESDTDETIRWGTLIHCYNCR